MSSPTTNDIPFDAKEIHELFDEYRNEKKKDICDKERCKKIMSKISDAIKRSISSSETRTRSYKNNSGGNRKLRKTKRAKKQSRRRR
jgi:hypothetical protein